jgi:hypothetical protein
MADILERFDFDDRPGLEKLRNMEKQLKTMQTRTTELEKAQTKAFESGFSGAEKFAKGLGGAAKVIGGVARTIRRVGTAATIAFGAATAAALKLSEQNEELAKKQEDVRSAWGNFTFELSKKFGPIIFGVQEAIIDGLNQMIGGVNNVSKGFTTDLGAAIIATGKTAVTFFKQLDDRFRIIILRTQVAGLEVKKFFSPTQRN